MTGAPVAPREPALFSWGPLNGVIPIVVTPFSANGSVDLDQLHAQAEFLVSRGVKWLGFGFGSEVNRLSQAALNEAVSYVVGMSAGRFGVIGNAEMTSVSRGVEEVERVREAGAHVAMVRPSGLSDVSQDALLEAFEAVATGSSMPVIVQDAPLSTGVVLSPSTLASLALQVPNVIALKIEPLNPARKMSLVSERLSGAKAAIIGGGGGIDYVHELERGAVATMPGPAYPELFTAIDALHVKGDRRQALQLWSRALPLMELGKRDMDTFLFVQKHVLSKRGVLSSTRLGQPHRDLDPRLTHEIDELLVELRLLELFDECGKVS
jgi:dihydrodipicolinate synthase/N-acetylneuraminate lyase